jgi:hypothetical protein
MGTTRREATDKTVTVGTDSTLVADNNESRQGLLLSNDDNETIYIGLGNAAVLGKMIRLNANGGSVCLSEDTLPFIGPVYAICLSGGKNLCAVEF